MSSKVIVRRRAAAAPPIVWPGAGEGCGPATAQGQPDSPRELAPDAAHAADQRIRTAHQAGYQEGLAGARGEAQAAAQAETRLALERLASTITELAALRPRLREQAESDLVRLAVAIARRVVRRELTVDPQAIEGLIQAALRQINDREVSRVRVHPDHEAVVRALVIRAGRENGIEVAGDRTLERGGAVFESARGNLDASVETQLQEIERGLTDRFRRSS